MFPGCIILNSAYSELQLLQFFRQFRRLQTGLLRHCPGYTPSAYSYISFLYMVSDVSALSESIKKGLQPREL